jgi:arylsulfatase A-like enzyme
MTSRSGVARAAAVGLCAAALAGFAAAGPAAAAERLADHVVFIALDGFDVEYLDDAPMPNLRNLVRDGSLSTSTGVMTSVTNPSWSSIATGAWPERHHNTAYWFNPATGLAVGQQRDIAVPTIGQSVREQGGTVMSAQWFILQNHGTAYGDPEGIYTQPGGDCSRRIDDAVAVIRGNPVNSGGTLVTAPKVPDLIAVYCDTLDSIGHSGGDRDPRIPGALTMVDDQVGRIVQATKDADIHDRTAFILTGDHGMTTFTQGLAPQVIDAIAKAGYRAQLLTAGQSPAAGTDAVIVVGGVGSLHLVGAAADDPKAAKRIRAAVRAIPHVRAVYDKNDQRRMHMSPNHGELVIEPEPGWSVGATPAGPVGVHGTTNERRVPLVLAGSGVRPGAVPHRPRHIDLAPTMAALLGMEAPSDAQGHVLREALQR